MNYKARLKKEKSYVTVAESGESVKITIVPFEYDNGKTRLPRKNSKGYSLRQDTEYCFGEALKSLVHPCFPGKA